MARGWHVMAGVLALPLLAACDAEPTDQATVRICPAHELEGQWQADNSDDEKGAVQLVEIEGRCDGLTTELVAVVHTACGRTPCKWPSIRLGGSGEAFQGNVESFSALRSVRLEPAGLLLAGAFVSRPVNTSRGVEQQSVMLNRLDAN